jgi:hypothetical protein
MLLLASSLFAQEKTVTITGSVVDSASGERIPYATVTVVGTTAGTVVRMPLGIWVKSLESSPMPNCPSS